MQAFTTHTGLVVAMDRANVDTDQIIPKQFLKRIERSGYGPMLFFDWRYLNDGKTDDPAFELNKPEAQGATVLLARRNFGCGSSREHAVWAIENYGFRVVIAPSFADIFYNNCSKNGVLPIRLSEEQVEDLFLRAAKHPGYRLNVDLQNCTVQDDFGLNLKFEIDPSRQFNMIHGLDDIALTLKHADKISAFEAQMVS
ncbi:3-isopropylmalate dehydratase small subunit 1 [Anatilimnocola aggregata]|uniref:3-isopropylmalate dehydratase small subunit n=1 Tax=Anatilimnocola aggregata TaxID=2528021 RepID=A0A517YIL3_9BACT|nr:3-isopropylmalate dehydratase small subunit [Anatilimnocola aggregata]QDU30073.1 3-isopropylmalate dehydratase small subunit 1 [Anatilimnocola aggregata]